MALCSDSVDTSGLQQGVTLSDALAGDQIRLGQDQFDWFRQEYDRGAAERASATGRAREVSDASLATMSDQSARATDYSNFERSTYRPLQEQIVAEARGFNTPERQAASAESASADVRIAQAGQQGALSRSLQRSGMNPGSGASLAVMGDMAFQGTKAEAGAATMARRNVEDTGFARMGAAANTGSYLPGAATSATQGSLTAGQSAGAASTEALRASTSGVPLMQQAFTGQQQANQSAGNLYAQSAALRNQQVNAGRDSGASFGQVLAGVGGIAQGVGAYYGMGKKPEGDVLGTSSKKAKTKKGDVQTDDALAQVNALDVDSWRYKPGVADGGQHIGPYAEDVHATMGERAAPGGKMVNLTMMGDRNAQAIKQLTGHLTKIEAQIAEMEA